MPWRPKAPRESSRSTERSRVLRRLDRWSVRHGTISGPDSLERLPSMSAIEVAARKASIDTRASTTGVMTRTVYRMYVSPCETFSRPLGRQRRPIGMTQN